MSEMMIAKLWTTPQVNCMIGAWLLVFVLCLAVIYVAARDDNWQEVTLLFIWLSFFCSVGFFVIAIGDWWNR